MSTDKPAPQPVELPRNAAKAGYLHALREHLDGTREACISWVEYVPGYRGGLEERGPVWVPEDEVVRMRDVRYDEIDIAIESVAAAVPEVVQAPAPPGWPAVLPPPSVSVGEERLAAWLLDAIPPGYRAHETLVAQPLVLAWMAAEHTRQAIDAHTKGYRSAAVELKQYEAPETIQDLLEFYSVELDRLHRLLKEVYAVSRYLINAHS
ncbi:hypothetical protein ACIBHY_29825 [Nonomuraea sp. NPDC050547]|uniref:hypothetical protein n=1 Tax=Nonomuraea sp. NPDC050547 TaxID=3364368 RepID=UPI0037B71D90